MTLDGQSVSEPCACQTYCMDAPERPEKIEVCRGLPLRHVGRLVEVALVHRDDES